MRWETLILPKIDGGIGIQDASHANTTLLEKLVWDLVQELDKLWVEVLENKYFGQVSVLEVSAKQNA